MRIVLYCHNSFGLGHLARTGALASAIISNDAAAQVLVITGCRAGVERLLPAHVDYLKLPSFEGFVNDSAGISTRPYLEWSRRRLSLLRSRLILATVLAFDPDVFVVDHSPLGLLGEIQPLIERSRRSRRMRTVLGCRGVVYGPDKAREYFQKHADVIAEFYDIVMAYTDPQVVDIAREYQLARPVEQRLRYTGYVSRCSGAPSSGTPSASGTGLDRKAEILVTAGGGAASGSFFTMALTALNKASGPMNLTVVTGPYASEDDSRAIENILPADAQLHNFADQLPTLIGRSDQVIGRGGYNTLADIVASKTPATIVPRPSVDGEQLDHARRLARLGYCKVVEEHEGPEALAAAIAEKLESRESQPAMLSTAGADHAARIILNNGD